MLLPRAFTLGLNLGATELTSPTPHAQEPVTISTYVVFDTKLPIAPLAIATPIPRIEKTISRADEAATQAAVDAARKRVALLPNRTAPTSATLPEPDFSTKRALVQEIASQARIDWKLLESVWQIESGKAWKTAVTSSAGALGPMQFMPGTWTHYGAGGDVTSAPDALRAGAKLLAANGAASGDEHRALFAYNHAEWYVQQVQAIKASI